MEKKKSRVSYRHIIIIVLVLVFGFLLMDLNTRLTNNYELNTQRDSLETEVAQLEATNQQLSTEVAYATSEAAVEDWARKYGHLYQPGDIPVIPIPPVEATQAPQVVITPTSMAMENWEVWQVLFFGR